MMTGGLRGCVAPADCTALWWQFAADVSWIQPALAVSGSIPPECVPWLAAELGIRHVVDMRAEACDDAALLHRYGVRLLSLPTTDQTPGTVAHLQRGAAWVRQALQAGGGVLIHCAHGVGRSVLLAACVLVTGGATPAEALRLIRGQRHKVCPSVEQLEALVLFTHEWHTACGQQPTPPSWDELARVAYSL